MKILWVCPFFLHPTNRGAQIRTLGTLKELHKRHDIYFAALNDPRNAEGPQRSGEYSRFHISQAHSAPGRRSLKIIPQILSNLFSPLPLAISRYASAEFRRDLSRLISSEHFDCIVCDFLAAAPNIESLPDSLLFEHNVETTIFQRHAQQSSSFLKRAFFRVQAARMEAYERNICKTVKHVIAVSETDANRVRRMFGVQNVTSVPTGVDIDYFRPPEDIIPSSDIVFCGSMDWLPNVDAVEFFVGEILPLIRAKLPGVTFTIAGRSPDARVLKAIRGIPGIALTGTVDDIRPYLWGSRISVVPIRIGGGTRLKIYECMAAGIPVVSTTVGAEGLRYTSGNNIMIADSPEVFAASSVQLLTNDSLRIGLARRAREFAVHNLSWGAVCREFEYILLANRAVPQKASIESAR